MPRLSITLTDTQAEALERISAETGATKQSMIALAVSDWLAARQPAPQVAHGWYGWADVTEPDPLSGEPMAYSVGYDGPYPTKTDAEDHARRIAASNREDGLPATPHVERR